MSAGLRTRGTGRTRADVAVGGAFALAVAASLLVGVPATGEVLRGIERGIEAVARTASDSRTPNIIAPAAVPTVSDPDLCASTGTVTMPDGVDVAIWGFSLDEGSPGCDDDEPQLPGPVIGATVGDTVTIDLTNADVPENVSIGILGTELVTDTEGVALGESTSYTFTVDQPGTYLYETFVGDRRGALMGLHGALIVRPAAPDDDTAYGDGTEFDEEAVLVLGEIDPEFNADPADFDLLDYHPTYWLINGEAYPDTDPIEVTSGERLLLRYLNAGSIHHTPALLGARQRVIAKDAYPVTYPYEVVSETVASGQTMDAITVPCGEADVVLHSGNQYLTNGGLSSSPHEPGGMQTLIDVTGTVCPAAGNISPTVDAGLDQTVTPTSLPATVVLDGTVNDDFVTPVTATWSDTGTFANASDVDTTVSFAAAGVYVLTLEADDGVNAVASDTVTITVNAPVLLHFSTEGDVNVGGLGTPDDADIYAWHGDSTYSRIFDATANGVPGAADVDALVVVDGNTFYMSFRLDTTIDVPPAGPTNNITAADEDVVLFDAGGWTIVFDGSDVGLTTNAEDVDAFEVLGAGVVVVSTEGNPDVGLPGAEQDEDLLRCAGTFGDTTTCTWSYYMDGSDVALTAAGEDVDGAAVLGGAVSLTTENGFSVTGASGADEDVFVCASLTPGTTTSCPGGWSLFFDGSVNGITDDLDAIDRP
jgi:FtsP/CotA-like multicopper oxidase with cupredoxin domain